MDVAEYQKSAVYCLGLSLALSVVVLVSGCRNDTRPRLRMGAFFGSPMGMSFPDPDHLGQHHYAHSAGEKLGMVYTCRGGFIDIGHVREAADRTAYLSDVTFRNLMLGRKAFVFRVIEPSRYWVRLAYPDNWEELPEDDREAIAREVSVLLGQYFARTSLVWHEILTWYGFSSVGIFPENISAFSWEDPYSDLLGTHLAVQALRDRQLSYDEAVTGLLDEALRTLEVQPPTTARRAVKAVEGKWYSGGFYFFVDMKRRNLDMGLKDGQITPWLVPGICPQAQPQAYPVPRLDFLVRYGFTMRLEIESRELEKSKIYHDLQLDPQVSHLRPSVHFPMILDHIQSRAESF